MSSIYRADLLAGKSAFLAGATSGINLAIARRFTELGAKVFIISRSQDKVDAAVAALGAEAVGQAADVRDYEAVENAVAACQAAHGAIDIVVSGAAGNFLAPAAKLSSKRFRTVIDIDLVGSFNVLRAAYPHLRRPGAAALTISALQSFMPARQQAHACAAKAGIDRMTRCLARLTPTPEAEARLTATITLRRYGETGDIADLAVYPCSEAGRNVTGAQMVSDGGQAVVGSAIEMGQ